MEGGINIKLGEGGMMALGDGEDDGNSGEGESESR